MVEEDHAHNPRSHTAESAVAESAHVVRMPGHLLISRARARRLVCRRHPDFQPVYHLVHGGSSSAERADSFSALADRGGALADP